ncbi:hypothetical protein [Aureibaculum conchae]|uniref:hypothetical protein n=1 Tax=Aureibaculum sp. 2308TA14-22 TaxID=3108392 RepID=UPI003391E854
MKTIKYTIGLLIFLVSFTGCEEEDNFGFLDEVTAPTNVSAAYTITQNNTGLVTITPNGEGAVSYNIDLGDGSEIVTVKEGENVQNIYPEGNYTIKIIAKGITGLISEATQELMVSFRAPENLEVTANVDSSNPFKINVSATADYAASFNVFFDTNNPDEDPTPLTLDGEVSFEYPAVGDYTIRVVALSGGAETTETTTVVTVSAPTELPIDFEIFDASTFIGFGGASAEVIDNPDTDGNSSAKVGKIVKGTPEIWAGTVITTSSPIDFSNKKLIKMNVWSPRAGGKVLLKLENLADGGIFFEKEATTVGNSAWEEVTFDLSDIDTSKEYQKVVLFFDFGTVGSGGDDWTFYIDDIKQAVPSVGVSKLPIQDFEGASPTFTVFGNIAATEVVANPDATGANTTANVAQLTKSAGAEVWAGTFFEVSPLDLNTYSKISVKTWSPKSGAVVKLKLENADASITHEVDLNTSVANAWEELIYDFSGAPPADYIRIVIFFDFGNAGDDSVYYYDEIELINEGGIPPQVFQDFEGAAPVFTVFGNIADIQVIANPDATGTNTTGNVAQLTKTAGSEVWAGTFFEVNPLDFNTYNKISVKTWSPKNGVVVKLKLENADASVTHEVDLNSSVANAWEELVYDFSDAPPADYVRVVIFFDFGNAGDDSVYYYDEFALTN